ncbi:MAG: hypothetical protein AAB783_00870 [Patescibacteria group bacterium]
MAYKTRNKRKQLPGASKTLKKKSLRTRPSRERVQIKKLTAKLAMEADNVKSLLRQLEGAFEQLMRAKEGRDQARSSVDALNKEKRELERCLWGKTEDIQRFSDRVVTLEEELRAKEQEITALKERIIDLNSLIVEFLLDKRKQS